MAKVNSFNKEIMADKLKLKKIPVQEPRVGIDMPERRLYPPSFQIEAEQMPEIKDWEVGKKYRLIVEIEQKSAHQNEKDRMNASFDIVAYKHLKPKSMDEMNDEEFDEYSGEALARGSL